MRFLLFSTLVLLASCASSYKALKPIPVDQACVLKRMPVGLATSWFDASVDVMENHISGLLLIKRMPDEAMRLVFTNEAGITYFDFAFDPSGRFKVHYAIKQLNRKAVIRTLQTDFELLLGIPFRQGNLQAWRMGNEVFYGVQQKKKIAYFITTPDCASLHRLEWASKRKRLVTAVVAGNSTSTPDSVQIQHHTFNMHIRLTKLEKE
ncbi:MAG: hypothetical protein JNM57_13480 [Cyclobacteriaceae bacterium]|nr:hypothetical protein [Cyclobacteriaceae bacterium]